MIGLSIVFVVGGPSLLAAAPQGGDGPVVSVSSTAGAVYGSALEIVFFNGVMLSELVWPLQPAFSVGTHASVEWPTGLALTANASFGLSGNVGTMTDSDWLNIAIQDSSGNVTMTGNTAKTNYSQSSTTLEGSTIVDAHIGWNIQPASGLTLQPYAGYKLIDYKWSAQDGYYQYPPEYLNGTYSFPATTSSTQPFTPWSSSETKYPLYGAVGLYEQTYSIPLVGISTRYDLSKVFSFQGSVSFSPVAWLNDTDHHLLTGMIYYDSFSGCTYIEPTLSVKAQLLSSFAIDLELSYLNITAPNNGVIVQEAATNNVGGYTPGSTGSSAGTASTAGAALTTFGATLSFKLSF